MCHEGSLHLTLCTSQRPEVIDGTTGRPIDSESLPVSEDFGYQRPVLIGRVGQAFTATVQLPQQFETS